MPGTPPPRLLIFKHPLFWLLVALALRLAYLLEQQAGSVLFYQPLLDEQEMVSVAKQLLAGGSLGREPLFKAPLYPVYLAGVMLVSGEGWFFMARLVQHLLGAALVLLAYDAARRTFSGPSNRWSLSGAVAAAAVALYGPLIRLEDSLILDFFALWLQSAMLWALIRMRTSPKAHAETKWAALAGLMAALAWLNRPTLTPVLPILALWIAGWRAAWWPKPWITFSSAGHAPVPEGRQSGMTVSPVPEGRQNIAHPFKGGDRIDETAPESRRDDRTPPFHAPLNPILPGAPRRTSRPGFSLFLPAARRRRLACAALFLALPAAAMALIYLRNATAGGEGMVLPWQGGYNFYYANRQGANGRYYLQQGYSLAAGGNPTRELAERQAASAISLPAPASGRRFHAIDRYWMDRAKTEIRQAPARWAGLMGRKLLYLASDREIFNFEVYEVHKSLSWILFALPVSFGVIWPLALASAAFLGAWPRGRRRLAGLLWLYGLALGGAIALYYTSGRMRMPLLFPAALLAGSGVEAAFRRGVFTRNTNLAWVRGLGLALLAIGLAMSWGDWWGVRSENLNHLEYARLSNAAWRAGEYPRALDFADACEREHPGYPSAALLRGQALYSLNRISDAAAAFTESLQRFPEDPVAPFNLGIIAYYDQPAPQRAAALFAEALRRQPGYHPAAWMGALARLRLGEPAQARELLKPYLPLQAGPAPERLLIAAAALYAEEKDMDAAGKIRKMIEQNRGEAGLGKLAEELKRLGIREP